MEQRSECQWVLASKDGTEHTLPPGMIFIGRQECDIIVDSASVDKRHAVIFFNPSDKQFHVKDLNSVTGTYLNGIRIPEQSYVKLNHMDCLRFGYGHEVFYVKRGSERAASSSPLGVVSPKRAVGGFGTGDLVISEDTSCRERSAPVRDAAKSPSPPPRRRSPSPLSPVRLSQSPPESVPLRRISLSSSPATQSSSTTSTARSPSTASTATLQSPSPSRPSATSPTLGSGNRQDADSLEDLSRTEEDCSSSTVREVVPGGRPPPHPTTLAWKPLRARAGAEDSAASNESPSPGDLRPKAKQSPSKQQSHDSSGTPVEPSGPDSKEASPGSGPESPERQPPLSASNSMAFTIPFDDDAGGTPGRRFGLKDSIKKFAPPKPEAERTPTKLRPSSVSLSKDVSGVKKVAPTPPGLNQNGVDAKRRWSALEGRGANDKGLVNGGQGESRPPSGWKPDLPKSSSRQDERLSDSATYLIQRMLNDGPPRAPLPGPPSGRQTLLGGSSSEPQLVSPGDDRSETGTYTVEMDRADPAVEEARRKIDEVFGVPLRTLPAGHDQKGRLEDGPGDQRPRCQGGSVDLGRPKRRLPAPPSERPPPEAFAPAPGSDAKKPTAASVPSSAVASAGNAARKRLGSSGGRPSPPCSPPRTHRTVMTTRPASARNPLSSSTTAATNMSQSVGPRIGCGGNRTTQPQRKPWGLSGSEADIAAAAADPVGAEETASVVSDTSTEPSSHSSGSRGGPTMKLNRAFALRRARLGLPDIGGLPPTAASGGSKKSLHGSNPSLSRQDGGRFSLRLPRGTRATDVALGRAELLRGKARGMHQRNDSDPGATFRSQQLSASDGERQSPRPSRRGSQRAGASSCISDGDDDGLRTGSPVLFNRSASFGAPNDHTPSVPERRKSRGTAFSRGDTFLKGAREGSDGGAMGGTFVRSSRGKVERQSGDGESKTPTENGIKTPSTTTPGRRELSALDSLVISAIHQLSGKLRTSARTLIERERFKYPENSDVRLMIEEVLPRVVEKRPGDSPTEGNLTKELSTILKNLKRIEQSLEVLNSLGPGESVAEKTVETKTPTQKPRGSFFYVDV
uniref:Putative ark protein kinase family n=1 Tax=Ixodes ricinus TaxID=34613 RepID=A0A131Y238_IXORI